MINDALILRRKFTLLRDQTTGICKDIVTNFKCLNHVEVCTFFLI